MQGWIKDHRKEIESAIWLMPPLYYKLWQYLKYKVNFEEKEIPMHDGSTFKILQGQHLTSFRNLATNIGWYEGKVWKEPNQKTIKSILDWMEKNKMIRIEHGRGNRQYTLVTVENWEFYQSEIDWGNSKVTVKKQQSNSQVTVKKQSTDIKKNDKNVKNDKNYILSKDNILSTPDVVDPIESVPYKEIIQLFNSICTTLPKIKDIKNNRQKTVRTLWKEVKTIEYFEKLFKNVHESDFLSGRSGRWMGCGFDWIIKSTSRQKIMEGNYKNKDITDSW